MAMTHWVQDLDESNLRDLSMSIARTDFVGIVSQAEGGIIAYAHTDHAATIVQSLSGESNTDTRALDKIATYLGTREEWNGGDALEEIARIINTVRPSVDGDASAYAATFLTATGRQAPDSYIALD